MARLSMGKWSEYARKVVMNGCDHRKNGENNDAEAEIGIKKVKAGGFMMVNGNLNDENDVQATDF